EWRRVIEQIRDDDVTLFARPGGPPVAKNLENHAARVDVKSAMAGAFERDASMLARAVQVEHVSAERALKQFALPLEQPLRRTEVPAGSNRLEPFARDEARELFDGVGIPVHARWLERAEPLVIRTHVRVRHHRAAERFVGGREPAQRATQAQSAVSRPQIRVRSPDERALLAWLVATLLEDAPLTAEPRDAAGVVAIEGRLRPRRPARQVDVPVPFRHGERDQILFSVSQVVLREH